MASIHLLLIADDIDASTRLRHALEQAPDMTVTGTARPSRALHAVTRRRPEVAVVDLRGHEQRGAHLIARLRDTDPALRVIAIGSYGNVWTAAAVVRAGACALITTEARTPELIATVRAVVRGEAIIAPRLLNEILETFRITEADIARPGSTRAGIASLSTREREILALVVEGLDQEAIARQLYLSAHTVRTHIRNIVGKLGVRSIADAVTLVRGAPRWSG